MPPQIALILCFSGMAWLMWRDVRNNPDVSHAIWIPVLWMAITESRLPSEWLAGSATSMASASAYLEGSPIDRNVFLGLIVLGFIVITSRRLSWPAVIAANLIVAIFLFYTFISIGWSDFPMTAFKRWHKVFGHVIMALVVYTERDPGSAFRSLFRRCAFLLIPLSVLFIKYYPEWGRGFDIWTGVAFNVGVTINKNTLGNQCLVLGLFFVMLFFSKSERGKIDRLVHVVFLGSIYWLPSIAHSASSLAATGMGAAIIIAAQIPVLRRNLTALLVVGGLIVGSINTFVNVKDSVIEGLGRDKTLTGRTDLWEELGKIETNPIIGVGFESFWLGPRVEHLWEKFWWKPNQAHNGYYEMYLNLGGLGVLLQIGMILGCYFKARKLMRLEPGDADPHRVAASELAQYRLAFALSVAAFNMTDATFKAIHMSFFVFFLVAIDYNLRQQQPAVAPSVAPPPLPAPAQFRPAKASPRVAAGPRLGTVPPFRPTEQRRL